MLIGVVGGLCSALLQSGSYVFSRVFIHRHRGSFTLVVFSQLIMGVFGALTIPLMMPFTVLPVPVRTICDRYCSLMASSRA